MLSPEILPAQDVRELRRRSACDGDSVADRRWYASEGLGSDREEAAETLCRLRVSGQLSICVGGLVDPGPQWSTRRGTGIPHAPAPGRIRTEGPPRRSSGIGAVARAWNVTATSELRRRCRCGQRRNSAGRAAKGRSDMIREFVSVRSSVAGAGALFGEAEVVQLSMARCTLLPLIRQSRGTLQTIIRAKGCWTRVRTPSWDRRVPVSRQETPRWGEPWDGPLPRVRLCGGSIGRGRLVPGCAGVSGVQGI